VYFSVNTNLELIAIMRITVVTKEIKHQVLKKKSTTMILFWKISGRSKSTLDYISYYDGDGNSNDSCHQTDSIWNSWQDPVGFLQASSRSQSEVTKVQV